MPTSWTRLAPLVLALAYFPLSSGIQCFYCTSESDTRCLDTSLFYSQTLTEQPSECTQTAVDTTLSRIRKDIPSPDGELGNYDCVKLEILSYNNQNNQNRTVIRGCAQGQTRKFDPCADLRQYFTNSADLISCNVCKTDACNGAPSHNMPSTNIFATLTLILTFFFTHF